MCGSCRLSNDLGLAAASCLGLATKKLCGWEETEREREGGKKKIHQASTTDKPLSQTCQGRTAGTGLRCAKCHQPSPPVSLSNPNRQTRPVYIPDLASLPNSCRFPRPLFFLGGGKGVSVQQRFPGRPNFCGCLFPFLSFLLLASCSCQRVSVFASTFLPSPFLVFSTLTPLHLHPPPLSSQT